jgi:hypothetical protein
MVASPRSATHTIEFSPAANRQSFYSEFYIYNATSHAPMSAPVRVLEPKRSMWGEQRARLSPLSGAAKKLVFNFLRR